jgi:hypothetical protein
MKRIPPHRRAAAPFALLTALAACAAAAPAKLTFTKSFPGSVPEYCSVEVDKSGALIYKESPTDDQPIKAQLPETDVTPLFELAQQLEFFKAPIESGLKVANTGKKTFRYESAEGQAAEVVFNYSTILAAQQLLDRFEYIAATERAWIDLDRTVHFDHLGINDSLAQVEDLWIKKELIAPAQFVPLLTRITSRESIMHLARERAARLKDEFEASKAAAAAGQKEE